MPLKAKKKILLIPITLANLSLPVISCKFNIYKSTVEVYTIQQFQQTRCKADKTHGGKPCLTSKQEDKSIVLPTK